MCELLQSTEMDGEKDVSTPLSTSTPLHLLNETVAIDETQYRRVIDCRQYLSLTCLDISFAMNKFPNLCISSPSLIGKLQSGSFNT